MPHCTRVVTALLNSSLNNFFGRDMVFRYRMSGAEQPVAQKK